MVKVRNRPGWLANDQAKSESLISDQIARYETRIIDELGAEAILVYLYLADESAKGNIDKNHVFQFVYRSFYRIDNAGLTPDFKRRYFEILERHRDASDIDLAAIAHELRPFKSLRDRQTLQFSFITKLAATANPQYPIYDAKVAQVFGFSTPSYGGATFEERLQIYMQFYEWLRATYTALLQAGRLDGTLKALETRYAQARCIPRMKALDFIFWTAGKLGIILVGQAG